MIVQAKATHAAIQVKRRMDSDQLRKALTNATDAREHLLWMCRDISRNPLTFFSAVLFFDEKSPRSDGKPSEIYKTCIEERFSDPRSWASAPDLIGSLQHHVYVRDQSLVNRLGYAGYSACDEKNQNIAVQLLLWTITQTIMSYGTQPPTVVPSILKSHAMDYVEITGPD